MIPFGADTDRAASTRSTSLPVSSAIRWAASRRTRGSSASERGITATAAGRCAFARLRISPVTRRTTSVSKPPIATWMSPPVHPESTRSATAASLSNASRPCNAIAARFRAGSRRPLPIDALTSPSTSVMDSTRVTPSTARTRSSKSAICRSTAGSRMSPSISTWRNTAPPKLRSMKTSARSGAEPFSKKDVVSMRVATFGSWEAKPAPTIASNRSTGQR